MIDAIGISASALAAQTTKVNVVADNVANAETPHYTAKQAQLVPMNPGVAVGAVVDTHQTVDLTTEMINLLQAKTAYEAAAEALRTATDTTNKLLASI